MINHDAPSLDQLEREAQFAKDKRAEYFETNAPLTTQEQLETFTELGNVAVDAQARYYEARGDRGIYVERDAH